MLSQRQKQHATPSEIAAVRQACKKLIKVGGGGADRASGSGKPISSKCAKELQEGDGGAGGALSCEPVLHS